MSASGQVRTPVGICAMCFGKRPLTHGWAWLKLCADCALIQQAPLRPEATQRVDERDDTNAPSSNDSSAERRTPQGSGDD